MSAINRLFSKFRKRENPNKRAISRRAALLMFAGMAVVAGQPHMARAFIFAGGAVAGVSPPSPHSPLTLTLNNINASTSAVGPKVSYAHPFKDGDIPANGSVTVTDSLRNPVTVQMD